MHSVHCTPIFALMKATPVHIYRLAFGLFIYCLCMCSRRFTCDPIVYIYPASFCVKPTQIMGGRENYTSELSTSFDKALYYSAV